MKMPVYTFAPQAPQFNPNATTPQEMYVRLVGSNLGDTRAQQIQNNVLIPDALPWSAQRYDLTDKDGNPTEVTGTDGFIYRYVYNNAGTMTEDAMVMTLDQLITASGLSAQEFYVAQNPTLPNSPVMGIRFWEIARSINARAFLDARPSITTGRSGELRVLLAMNFVPQVFCAWGLNANSLSAWYTKERVFTTTQSGSFTGGSIVQGTNDTSSRFIPDVVGEPTELLVPNLREVAPAEAFENGEYFMYVRVDQHSAGTSSIGQLIFANKTEVGFMDADSSSQDIEDLSDSEFRFDGALITLARPSVLNGRQTLLFPRLEMAQVKRFFRKLYPQQGGLIEHVPTLAYASEDVRLGTLQYATVSSAATFSYKQATSDIGQVTFDLRELS